ncbi:MAG TPA: 3-isopropylmalate dehydratase [Candidatus Methylacidiphilales bacterium]
MSKIVSGPAFVVKDNIDTDQIIPAQYLMLVPTVPAEYEKLGSYAMIGLPEGEYKTPFVKEGQTKTEYAVLIAGKNLGCGSSREHAPIAIGAAGCKVAIAETYARIFFRNCIATGEVFPYESNERLVDVIKTGDHVEVDFEKDEVRANGKTYPLKPLGDVRPVVEAGGIFNYARKTGMIAAK